MRAHPNGCVRIVEGGIKQVFCVSAQRLQCRLLCTSGTTFNKRKDLGMIWKTGKCMQTPSSGLTQQLHCKRESQSSSSLGQNRLSFFPLNCCCTIKWCVSLYSKRAYAPILGTFFLTQAGPGGSNSLTRATQTPISTFFVKKIRPHLLAFVRYHQLCWLPYACY